VPGTPTAPPPLGPLIDAVEGAEALDAPAKAVGKKVREIFGPGVLRDVLAGTWIGHALHPILTDVVIGSWTSATLLDVIGGEDDGGAASKLIGVGIAAAVPTALTGTVDWSDSEAVDDGIRRIGVVHAVSNVTALALYSASLAARSQGNYGRGKLLGLAGAGVMGAAAFFGGHLSFGRGVGVNQTAFDAADVSDEWTDAIAADDLEPNKPKSVVVADTPVMLIRHDDGLHALHDRCSHRGCSLSGMGDLEGEIITCGCHGSQFDVRDGIVQRGPAATAQPVYEARESDGRIQIRLASSE
jgi:nitrite reductase/ring-hydroxylating ferredoxin subunit